MAVVANLSPQQLFGAELYVSSHRTVAGDKVLTAFFFVSLFFSFS